MSTCAHTISNRFRKLFIKFLSQLLKIWQICSMQSINSWLNFDYRKCSLCQFPSQKRRQTFFTLSATRSKLIKLLKCFFLPTLIHEINKIDASMADLGAGQNKFGLIHCLSENGQEFVWWSLIYPSISSFQCKYRNHSWSSFECAPWQRMCMELCVCVCVSKVNSGVLTNTHHPSSFIIIFLYFEKKWTHPRQHVCLLIWR